MTGRCLFAITVLHYYVCGKKEAVGTGRMTIVELVCVRYERVSSSFVWESVNLLPYLSQSKD